VTRQLRVGWQTVSLARGACSLKLTSPVLISRP